MAYSENQNPRVYQVGDTVTFDSVKNHTSRNGTRATFWNGAYGQYCAKATVHKYGDYNTFKQCWEITVKWTSKDGWGDKCHNTKQRMLESEFKEWKQAKEAMSGEVYDIY